MPYAQPLIITKKERAILDDRPTECKSKLILLVRLAAELVERITGIELVVSKILEQRSPDLVCA